MTVAATCFWDGYQVAEFDDTISLEASVESLERRNSMYPGVGHLMPVTGHHGETVIDFGCGPGHDTLGFLIHGAHHVYAVDSSWKGLSMVRARVAAHGYQERCTLVNVRDGDWLLPPADHVHTAGVIHHLADPSGTLYKLAGSLLPGAEIRMMVYNAESWFYQEKCAGDPERFRACADPGAPISNAWTKTEVRELAANAGLRSTYVGSYLDPCEPEGNGLMSCYSLRQRT